MMEPSSGDNDTSLEPEATSPQTEQESKVTANGSQPSPPKCSPQPQPPQLSPGDVWSPEVPSSPAQLPAPALFSRFESHPADGKTVDQSSPTSNSLTPEGVADKDTCHNGANQMLSSQTDCSTAKDTIKRSSHNRPCDLDLQPMSLTLKQLVFRKDVINRNRQNWVICDEDELQRNGEMISGEAESKLGWDDQRSDSPDSWNYEKTSPTEAHPDDDQNGYVSEPSSDSCCHSNSDEAASPVNSPPPRKSAKKTKLMALQHKELQQDKTVLAPPLNDNLQFHAFFMYHHSDRDWVLNVIEKLESPALGFRCCCYERDLNSNLSQPQGILYGMKHSLKTIIILSPEFVSKMWTSCEAVIGDVDVITLQKDFVLVLLSDCEVPDVLTMANFVRANKQGWWTRFLARLALPDDTPMTEETVLSMSSSLVGLTPGLQSGHLLSSLKSKCHCCGYETIESTEVPDELLAHGIQIPPDEFQEAVGGLMGEAKFRCHTWCYNMPLAIIFFALLLGLSLAIVPVIEANLVFGSPQAGMEYLHGAIVWLCILTIYMFLNHISRRKMKRAMYGKLAKVNTVFIKYNILTGVENLGLADCNKYYLHFFYYELGPCLGYLQELLGNVEEYQPSFTNCVLELDSGAVEGEEAVREVCEEENGTYENITVHLHNNNTNVSMQNQAEDLLLDHSGEYIYRLITKKLDRPRKQRHVKGSYCLCQFVEHRVYKMVV